MTIRLQSHSVLAVFAAAGAVTMWVTPLHAPASNEPAFASAVSTSTKSATRPDRALLASAHERPAPTGVATQPTAPAKKPPTSKPVARKPVAKPTAHKPVAKPTGARAPQHYPSGPTSWGPLNAAI